MPLELQPIEVCEIAEVQVRQANGAAVRLWGAVLVGVLAGVYTSLYWNRFLAPSAGATSFWAAEQILNGRMPYRDFLFLTTPLHALKTALLIHWFGDRLVVPRFEAAAERTVLAVLLYFWLLKVVRPAAALTGAMVAIFIFAGDAVDSLADYHHDAVFWAVGGGFAASVYLTCEEPRRRWWIAIAAGLLCGLAFITKQTAGAGVTGAVGCAVGILEYRRRGIRGAGAFVGPFGAAFLAPLAIFLAWLWRGQALDSLWACMFMTSTSKGPYGQVFTRLLRQTYGIFPVTAAATPALAYFTLKAHARAGVDRPGLLAGSAACFACVVALAWVSVRTGWFWPGSEPYAWPKPHQSPPLAPPTVLYLLIHWSTIALAVTGGAFIFIHHTVRLCRKGLDSRGEQIWLMAAVSFGVAYMLSLSWALYCPMAVPGTALVCALALDRLLRARRMYAWVVFGAAMSLSYASAGSKYMKPYSWIAWVEPRVTAATHESKLPQLAGLRISEPTLSIVENVTELVNTYTPPGGTLLVYPYFPLFYSLTGRQPATYVFNHYIDVCPDRLCRIDAAAIELKPPDAIVYMVEDDAELAKEERVFRSGLHCASRDVAAAIERLAPGYRKLLSVRVPGSFRTLEVYSRRREPFRKVIE